MNITVEAYNPDGFKTTFQTEAKNIFAAQQFTQSIARAGYTATAPDIGKRKNEIITAVVRREHVDKMGKVTPVVDLYPAWGVRDYGQYRFVNMYLNSDAEIEQFEARAGVKLDDLPLLPGENPLKRNRQRITPNEIKCKPFVAVKEYEGEKEIGGKMQHVWKFVRYGEMQSAAPAPDPAPAATPPPRPALPAQTAGRTPLAMPTPGSIRPAAAPTSLNVNQAAPLQSHKSS